MSAVAELLDDPAARRRLAESGRRRLAADYSREAVRQQLLDVVRAIDAETPAAAAQLPEAAVPRLARK